MAIDVLHTRVGSSFTLTVEDMAGAGYIWNMMPFADHQIDLLDEGLTHDLHGSALSSEEKMNLAVGGNSHRTLTFKAKKAGIHVLRLKFSRSWLGDNDDTALFRDLQVHVAD